MQICIFQIDFTTTNENKERINRSARFALPEYLLHKQWSPDTVMNLLRLMLSGDELVGIPTIRRVGPVVSALGEEDLNL